MKTRVCKGLIAALLLCGAVACSDNKEAGEVANTEAGGVPVPAVACGNDIREAGELCDGTDVGIETCVSQGFDTGTLGCNDNCDGFSTTTCTENPDPRCGNNIQEIGETCDGRDLAGQSCTLMGFAGGSLGCLSNCAGYDTAGCTMEPAACGNGVVDGTEVCDGEDLGDTSCESLGLGEGTLKCKEDCTGYETRECVESGAHSCVGPTRYRGNGLNTDLPDGEPCNFDGDCLSGSCNDEFYCGATGVTPAVHEGDLPLGAACDGGASCESGYCWGGADAFICAETCAEGVSSEEAAPGMNCTSIGADNSNPPATGAACVPKGAGFIGDLCETGAFDCRSGSCWKSEFCTQRCDPTNPEACADGGSYAATCELVTSEPVIGDAYLCIPSGTGHTVTEGGACEYMYECLDGLTCLDAVCRQTCSAEQPCPEGTYCAEENPAGAICLPDAGRLAVGEACENNSQCVEGAICYDVGVGAACQLLCPEGADQCVAAGLAASCTDMPTGVALDTGIAVYNAVDAAEPVGTDDDDGERFFSRFERVLEEGTNDYWIQVSHYPNGPSGAYSLTISLNGVLTGNVVSEDETTPNDTRDGAQVITLGDRVDAAFINVGEADDVDVFMVTVTAQAGDRLLVETSKALAGICHEVVIPLLEDGAPCESSDACINECFSHVRDGAGFCASRCETAENCDGGECIMIADNAVNQGYCFPAGEIMAGTLEFGEVCNGAFECASRICTRHPVEETYRCGAPCQAADVSCGDDAGRCLAPEAIYNIACVPHLGGSVVAGGSCHWTADCVEGNLCQAGSCLPEVTSSTRYHPEGVVNGMPCNGDADCLSGMCNDKYICGADADAAPCAGCLENGQPCNQDLECAGGACFAGDRAVWFCAESCEGPEATCEGELFGATDLSCVADRKGKHACVPGAGVGAPADPCESGYLDCESGVCFDQAFCISSCSASEEGECGREADCVVYESKAEPERQLDTDLTILGDQGVILAENDNIMYNSYVASYYSSVSYTNTSADAMYVWLRVQSGLFGATTSGNYQLQVYTSDNPPPFGNPIVESELRESPVDNSTMVLAHDLMAIGFPVRIAGSLPEGSYDVDHFRVELEAGQTVTVNTTAPMGFVCWPTEELEAAVGTECEFDFECSTGVCLGTCAAECTGGNECEAGYECDSFTEDNRSYCFKSLKFGESCEGSAQSTAVSWEYPSCPNNACFLRQEGEPMWCSANCEESMPGAGCGNLEEGSYDGECYERSDGFFCVPHQNGALVEGDSCLLNGDCATGCCTTYSGQCGTESCYGN